MKLEGRVVNRSVLGFEQNGGRPCSRDRCPGRSKGGAGGAGPWAAQDGGRSQDTGRSPVPAEERQEGGCASHVLGGPEPQNHQPRGHRVLTTVTDESIMTRATAKTTYTVWNFPKTELQKGKVKSEGSEGGLIAGVATAVRSARGDSRAGRGLQWEVTRPVSARPARGARLGRASRPLLKTAQDGHPPGGDRGSRRLCERSGLGFPGPLRKAQSPDPVFTPRDGFPASPCCARVLRETPAAAREAVASALGPNAHAGKKPRPPDLGLGSSGPAALGKARDPRRPSRRWAPQTVFLKTVYLVHHSFWHMPTAGSFAGAGVRVKGGLPRLCEVPEAGDDPPTSSHRPFGARRGRRRHWRAEPTAALRERTDRPPHLDLASAPCPARGRGRRRS